MTEKVSIVIPVHNGAGKLEKTVKQILKQSYKNIEVVLVENFSEDNSLEICNALSQYDSRVKVFQSFERGTTYARKKGILSATGEYITFSDQDDSYIRKDSIERMYHTIKQDNVQICQFAYYVHYGFGFKRKMCFCDEVKILPYDEFIHTEFKGLFEYYITAINANVWTKIYQADIIQKAALKVEKGLFSAEDLYLNLLTYTTSGIETVSFHPEAYYVWNLETGFSSSDSGSDRLYLERNVNRLMALEFVHRYNMDLSIIYELNYNTLFSYKERIGLMINKKTDKQLILQRIATYETYEFIRVAKEYFRTLDRSKYDDTIAFMIGDYTPEELYDYCNKTKTELKLFSKIHLKYQNIVKKK